jgi:hypothetical protein
MVETSSSNVHRRRRRIEESGWRSIPNTFKILACVSLALMALIPLSNTRGWFKHKSSVDLSSITAKQSDLELVEAQFQDKSRTIKGVVVNSSATPYKDVVISYNLRSAQGEGLGAIEATLAQLGPHDKASFETAVLPKDALTYELREIVGTAR